MGLFKRESAFYVDPAEQTQPGIVIANDIGQIGLQHRLAAEKHAAKEDAIHALRRIEHDLRASGNDIADDLDAAISLVIDA